MSGKVYDLKVGYTCNNFCFHCVVEPNKRKLQISKTKEGLNLTYKDIIALMDSSEFKNADTIVLTGGEVTLRRDFLRILRSIKEKSPNKKISIQTNGRLLKQYIKDIKDIGLQVFYVIALHSTDEELHDRITGAKGRPFEETWATLEEIKDVYGDFGKVARIEIVLSRLNLHNLEKTIIELYKNEIKHIGISYPHLDGHFFEEPEAAKKIGFTYAELKEILPAVYKFAENRPDLNLYFEKVPKCMWRDKENKLFKPLNNIRNMENDDDQSVVVTYPESPNMDFSRMYFEMHRKVESCQLCYYHNCCPGVWFESIEMFGDKGFTPITKNEEREVLQGVFS